MWAALRVVLSVFPGLAVTEKETVDPCSASEHKMHFCVMPNTSRVGQLRLAFSQWSRANAETDRGDL
jgi:hypothetical protein